MKVGYNTTGATQQGRKAARGISMKMEYTRRGHTNAGGETTKRGGN